MSKKHIEMWASMINESMEDPSEKFCGEETVPEDPVEGPEEVTEMTDDEMNAPRLLRSLMRQLKKAGVSGLKIEAGCIVHALGKIGWGGMERRRDDDIRRITSICPQLKYNSESVWWNDKAFVHYALAPTDPDTGKTDDTAPTAEDPVPGTEDVPVA